MFIAFALVSCIGKLSQQFCVITPLDRTLADCSLLVFPVLLGVKNLAERLAKNVCDSINKKQAGHAALTLAKTCEEMWAQAPVTIIHGTHTAEQHQHVKLKSNASGTCPFET